MHQKLEQLHAGAPRRSNVLPQLANGSSAGKALLFEREADFAEPDSGTVDELLRIHEYERQRMGQELHDSAGQLLVSLQFSVAHLKRVEEGSGHEDLLEEIQETVRQIDQEIRSLAFLHYPVELGTRGLSSAVQALARGFGRRTGIRTSFKASGDQSIASDSISKGLLRVAQEALVNVHRHAHASQASVLLKRIDNRVELIVSDNGVGMPTAASPAKAQGIGLRGMRYRIEALGGRFAVRHLKQGTRISASVPIAV
jgi:two-component system NarL family sensor kinase